MDAMGWIAALRRRWVLALVLLLPTLFATAALALKPGPYQAESQVAVLPSKQASKPFGGNPYLTFTNSVNITADLVRREVTTQQTAQRLAAQGFASSYQIVDDPDPSAPVLDITATGNNAGSVIQTLRAVTSTVRTTLGAIQSSIKQPAQMTSVVLSIDPQASAAFSHKVRRVLTALGLGLVVTIALPLLVDAIQARRNEDDLPQRGSGRLALDREPTMVGVSARHGR